MFGGLVAFSYCSHFVLITVVRIAPRPNAACLPTVSQMTLSVHLNIDGEFLRCLEHLLLVTKAKALTVQRQGRVYYTAQKGGRTLGEKMQWGGWVLAGPLVLVVSLRMSLLCISHACARCCSVITLVCACTWCAVSCGDRRKSRQKAQEIENCSAKLWHGGKQHRKS